MESKHGLEVWGWNSDWAEKVGARESGLRPGRVVGGAHEIFRVALSGETQVFAKPFGKLRDEDLWPVVGDWVLVRERGPADFQVEGVLERKSCLQRKKAGKSPRPQRLAANVDFVFVVCNPSEDFSLNRVDRYVVLAWEAGAVPVVLLNKSDLTAEVETWTAKIQTHLPGVEVLAVSAVTGAGLEGLRSRLAAGKTGVFVGSSGVGKSSLMNRLAGEDLLVTSDVRGGDDKGRHTTTARELHRLPWGSLIIDTPGLREVGLVGAESGISKTFGDIEELAAQCKFGDCRHVDEPGCRVREAIEGGGLAESRLESFQSLEKEAAWMRSQEVGSEEAGERKRHSKVMQKALRQRLKQKGRR